MTPTLANAMAAGPVVLDGGLGTLLAAHGHDLSSSLWSAQLLLDDPAAIRRAHTEYFRSGARVAISSSYQVSYEGLDAAGHDRAQVDTLLARSVQLAREARDAAGLSRVRRGSRHPSDHTARRSPTAASTPATTG